jgi:hypothetical protein
MNTIKVLIILLMTLLFSCKMSNENNKQNLQSFFSKTDWKDFNRETLTKNNLKHFIADSVDFFHREDFFSYMKNSNHKITYDNFYLVEIINQRTEKITARKIIALKNDDKISYLFFKDSQECSSKGNFSDAQVKKYEYENLVVGTSKDGDDNIIITKITGDKY